MVSGAHHVGRVLTCSLPYLSFSHNDSLDRPWLLFVTLPGFAISLALWTKARLRTNQTVATLVIAFCSYASYYFANQVRTACLPPRARNTEGTEGFLYLQIMASEPEVSSAVGAAVVGLLGTLWSRVARGTAFTTQSAAILLLVPNGLAAAGGIVMSSSSGTQSFYEGAQVALRQIQTSVGEFYNVRKVRVKCMTDIDLISLT